MGQSARVALPQAPAPLAAFCNFSGLSQLAMSGTIGEVMGADHPENETAPLQQFNRSSWGGSTPIARLIRRHFPSLAGDSEELLRTCYQEIAQNIEDHAESPIGGVICARFFVKQQEVRIAVADRGLGIGETLRRAKAGTSVVVRDDAHALKLVLGGNVSSKSRLNNMGHGISNMRMIAAGNRGRLIILSGAAYAIADQKGWEAFPAPSSVFPGTLVLLSLRVTSGENEHDGE
jgi:anti-sigma regulatory factor (Ser/Thr protein kinase)